MSPPPGGRSFEVVRADLTASPDSVQPDTAQPDALAAALRRGALIDAAVLDPAGCDRLVAEIGALQAARFDPRQQHFTEIMVAEREASLGWGTAAAHGLDPIDLALTPTLAAVTDRVARLSAALRAAADQPDERLLLSITPSIGKDRSFPRFYHQDSPARPHCYRMVWDLGLERPGEILDVHFVPVAAMQTPDGQLDPARRHLFQQVEFADHYALDDAQIDARQPQVREETLPTPHDRVELRRGHALIWIDAAFYHSTYLRAGRALTELREAGRSIVIIREIVGHRDATLPDDETLRRLLGDR